MMNHLFDLHSAYQGSWSKVNRRKALQLQADDGTAPTANQTDAAFQLCNWLGALNDWKVFLADRVP